MNDQNTNAIEHQFARAAHYIYWTS